MKLKQDSSNLLIATLGYYRDLASKETNPELKAHYEKQQEKHARKIDRIEGIHTVTQARVDSALAFLKRLH